MRIGKHTWMELERQARRSRFKWRKKAKNVNITLELSVALILKALTGSSVPNSSVHTVELPPWTRLSPQQQEGTPCILSSSDIHPAAPRCFSDRRGDTASGTQGEAQSGGRHGLLTRDRKRSPTTKRHGCSFLLPPPPPGRFPKLLRRFRRQEIRWVEWHEPF